MWSEFKKHHPKWPDENLDWSAIGMAAALMGDVTDAQRQFRNIVQARTNDPAWEMNEMYWVLLGTADIGGDGRMPK